MGGKGKGKATMFEVAKGKGAAFEYAPPPEPTLEEQLHAVMPAAAQARLDVHLCESEWSVATTTASKARPGTVCFAKKKQLVEVLRTIGETSLPTAVIVSESAEALGLAGYPCQTVVCQIRNPVEGPDYKLVRKHLIQLGLGIQVRHQLQADQTVTEVVASTKVVLHVGEEAHWASVTASAIVAKLELMGIEQDL
eukprot:639582-Amphidinium_carterae.1